MKTELLVESVCTGSKTVALFITLNSCQNQMSINLLYNKFEKMFIKQAAYSTYYNKNAIFELKMIEKFILYY